MPWGGGLTAGGDHRHLRAEAGEHLRPAAGDGPAAHDHRLLPRQIDEQREAEGPLLGQGPPGFGGGMYLDLAGAALQLLRRQVLLERAGEEVHRPPHGQLHQAPGLRAVQIGGQYPGGHRLLDPLQAGQAGAVVLPLGHLLQVPLHDLRGGGGHLPPCVHP